jgi:DNA-binding transcriptional ArsR family regulator
MPSNFRSNSQSSPTTRSWVSVAAIGSIQPGMSSFAFTVVHSAHRERSAEDRLTYSHMRMYKEGVPRASTTSDPFNAVAEPRRRDILEFLAAEERSVSEIVDSLELAQPSVSKHLNVLRNVGLVTARRDGKRMFYRTNAQALRTIHDWSGMFAQHWRGQLRRIKAHAEGKR